VREWFLRAGALAQARGRQLTPPQRGALKAARQAVELADRALDLPEGYCAGAPLGAALVLYQEAIWWALQVVSEGSSEGQESLAGACEANLGLLRASAGDERQFEHLRTHFLQAGRRTFHALDAESLLGLVADARDFCQALIGRVGEPETHLQRVTRQRWLRPLAGLLPVAFIVLGIVLAQMPKNIAANKVWTASSRAWTFQRTGNTNERGADALMFHTAEEHNPWLKIDLGATHSVRGIKLENRGSCCQERAIPLVVEVSVDGKSWTEVARRSEHFTSWKASFGRAAARYVRLRVLRHTMFHLESVEVLGSADPQPGARS
jgi:hypothetical protein